MQAFLIACVAARRDRGRRRRRAQRVQKPVETAFATTGVRDLAIAQPISAA